MTKGCQPVLTVLEKIHIKRIPTEIELCMHAQSLQSCLTLCDHTDCSPSGSSVRGILQARILEWVAMTRGSSDPEIEPASPTLQAESLPLSNRGSPEIELQV